MTDSITTQTLEVRKDGWNETRVIEQTIDGPLAEGEVLFKVDRLALTSNNITYAATGDALGYWGFFPTEEGWGRIPGMGWGEAIASNHSDVPVGERVWGWFPYGTHLKVSAGDVNPAKLVDVSPHRAEYAPVYAQLDRASASPIYKAEREDHDSLLRGLFVTSWLVEDFLEVNDRFGADTCLITSASSKTSIALGYCVKQRGKLRSVGITSPGNVAFCEGLGCYDEVIVYDDVQKLDADSSVVLVDMAGNVKVITALHQHFGDNMRHSCRIGATHYTESGKLDELPGAKPQFFFAPTHVKTRSAELGLKEFMVRQGTAFVGFRESSDKWLKVRRSHGPEAVTNTYLAVLGGNVDPAEGQIVSLWPE